MGSNPAGSIKNIPCNIAHSGYHLFYQNLAGFTSVSAFGMSLVFPIGSSESHLLVSSWSPFTMCYMSQVGLFLMPNEGAVTSHGCKR